MDGIVYLLNQAGIALASSETELQRLRAIVGEGSANTLVLEVEGYKIHRTSDPRCFIVALGDRWLSGIQGRTPEEALERARTEVAKG